MHMSAALVGCRSALVGTGWITSHVVSTNGCVKITPLPLKSIISVTVNSFLVRRSIFWSESHEH